RGRLECEPPCTWPRSWPCAITLTYRRSTPVCWPPASPKWPLSGQPCASWSIYASACLKTAPHIAAITRQPLDCQDGIFGVRHRLVAWWGWASAKVSDPRRVSDTFRVRHRLVAWWGWAFAKVSDSRRVSDTFRVRHRTPSHRLRRPRVDGSAKLPNFNRRRFA